MKHAQTLKWSQLGKCLRLREKTKIHQLSLVCILSWDLAPFSTKMLSKLSLGIPEDVGIDFTVSMLNFLFRSCIVSVQSNVLKICPVLYTTK